MSNFISEVFVNITKSVRKRYNERMQKPYQRTGAEKRYRTPMKLIIYVYSG